MKVFNNKDIFRTTFNIALPAIIESFFTAFAGLLRV